MVKEDLFKKVIFNERLQTYLRDIVGLFLDHSNEAIIAIK